MAPRIPTRLRCLVLGLALLLGACSATPASSPTVDPTAIDAPTFPLTLTDDAARTVTLAAPPARIVSLAPSNTEIVCALSACESLVGVTDFDDYPPQVVDLPKVVAFAQVDVERVLGQEPDLVLAAGNELTPTAVIEQLADLGLNVMVLYPADLDGVYADIELLGAALDRRDEATDLVTRMQGRVSAVVEAVAGAERPLTFYEVYYGEGTIYTAGSGSFIASLLELAGAEPVTGDAQGVIGVEELVVADPELILLGDASYDPTLSDPATAAAALAARQGWERLTAVRQGQVAPFLADVVTTRPGPRIVDGLEALARAIHPERFE